MTKTTGNRPRLYSVVGTVLNSKIAVGRDGLPFVTAQLRLKNGRERTAETYRGDMMALLGNATPGTVVSLYGAMDNNTFSPMGGSMPRTTIKSAA